jgi:trk system potassium uptake protein TrkH
MLVGGTAFSTAGGIKITRFLYIFKKLAQKTNLLSHSDTDGENISASISSTSPQFRKDIEKYNINKSDQSSRQKLSLLSDKAFRETLMVISLFIIFSIGSGISLTFLTNNSFIDSLFESVSTISNTGLSVGITAMDLDLLSKMILSSNMIIGRFEIIAIFYIFIFRLRI